MVSAENKPYYQIVQDAQRAIRANPEKLSTAYGFSSGYFGDIPHKEIAEGSPELTFPEQIAARAIDYYLTKYPRVVMVDLGAMLGFSMTVLGKYFDQEVRDGRLVLAATNREKFTIEKGIAEAQRRLNLNTQYQELVDAPRAYLDSDDWEDYRFLQLMLSPILQTQAEIDFLADNHHRVRYLDGVKTDGLPRRLNREYGIGQVHLVHENYGGIENADSKYRAIRTVGNLLAPDGILLSSTQIWYEEEAFDEMEKEYGMRTWFIDRDTNTKRNYVIYALGALPRESLSIIAGQET